MKIISKAFALLALVSSSAAFAGTTEGVADLCCALGACCGLGCC